MLKSKAEQCNDIELIYDLDGRRIVQSSWLRYFGVSAHFCRLLWINRSPHPNLELLHWRCVMFRPTLRLILTSVASAAFSATLLSADTIAQYWCRHVRKGVRSVMRL